MGHMNLMGLCSYFHCNQLFILGDKTEDNCVIIMGVGIDNQLNFTYRTFGGRRNMFYKKIGQYEEQHKRKM
jgi:hypothetical protein